jgi:hypothetical protein
MITKRRVRVAVFAALLSGLSAMTASRALGYVADTCTEAAALGLLPIPDNPNHVTLCHFTGSTGNPFVINQPSLSAAETHIGHHDDCARYADGHIVCGL